MSLYKKVLQFLRTHQGKYSPQEIAANLKVPTEIEFIYKILEQLYQNQYLGIKKKKKVLLLLPINIIYKYSN